MSEQNLRRKLFLAGKEAQGKIARPITTSGGTRLRDGRSDGSGDGSYGVGSPAPTKSSASPPTAATGPVWPPVPLSGGAA